MKRCPQCGREYDNSMSFCLDDGAELLYGPTSSDEPATAVLHEIEPPAETATKAQILMTQPVDGPPSGQPRVEKAFDKRILLAPLVLVVLALGVFFGYRYFASASSKQIESIAVMPFVNDSGNTDVEYLSDGMTETLISSLTQLPNLNVKARSSVFRYKGTEKDAKTLGKELNVQAILNGRIAQHGDELMLSLELVDVATENAIWSRQYKRKLTDIVSLQSEIAKEVSTKLKTRLSGAEETKVTKPATTDPDAYQAYIKGRFYWNQRGQGPGKLAVAIDEFNAAVAKDPNYALAYAGLADCYALMPQERGTAPSEAVPKAKAFANRALEIDESLGEAHATLGLVYQSLWQWSDAGTEYERAIELNPNYPTAHQWYATFLGNMGRSDERLAEIKKAYDLDPLSPTISVNFGLANFERGESAVAVEQFNKTLEISPNNFVVHASLAIAYLKLGRTNEAVLEAQKSVELSKRHGYALSVLGYVSGRSGNRNDAYDLIREIENNPIKGESDKCFIAVIYSGLGDKDQAFAWLEKGFQEHSSFITNLRIDPLFEPLRDDPRFINIVQRMGLPQ